MELLRMVNGKVVLTKPPSPARNGTTARKTYFATSFLHQIDYPASTPWPWRVAMEDVKPYPEAPASQMETDGHAWFQLAAIIESPDDAIISKDLQGIVTSWNQGAHRIFGYTAGDMMGRSILRLIPEALQYEEEDILTKLRAGKRIDH
jgi:PAS domain-containing protein